MARQETEFIKGCQVVRVGNRDCEHRAFDADRDGQVLARNVLGNQFDRGDIDLSRVQINRRNPVVSCESQGDGLFRDEIQRNKARSEAAAMDLLIRKRLLQLSLRDYLVGDEQFTNSR